MPNYKIMVNGQSRDVNVDADTPLLWVLRDELKLVGTKYGCGISMCGACTVHVDGEAIRSCSTPISNLNDKNITTIEGLSKDGDHPLQRAWKEHDVPQCGYCQSGQIMSAAALLKKHGRPTDEQINETMYGNICRCGTYNRIKAAIKTASKL